MEESMTDNKTTVTVGVAEDRTKDFLDVEDMANNLMSRLSRLDEEVNRYAGAATSLGESAKATLELIKAVRIIGENTSKALEVIASVGGPKIVQRLAAVESKIGDQKVALVKKVNLAIGLAGAAATISLAIVVLLFLR
jgi:hypothetical protein